MLLPYVRRLVQRLTRRAARRSSEVSGRWPAAFRPRLEVLEDRTLPAQVFWTNPAGGDWSLGSNWSSGFKPTANDDVVIDVAGNVTVTHSTGNDAIHSLLSNDAFVLSGGSLDLATTSTLNSTITFSNGTLSGRGDLTINDQFTWSGGTMTGTGHTVANGGLALSNPNSFISATTLDGRQLDNAGSAVWTGPGNITISNGGVFNNLAGASFSVSADAQFVGSGALGAFNNAGTFNKVDSSGTTIFGISFNNSGTVDVQTGTLSLNAGGDSTGSFTAESGTNLNFTGGTTLRSASSVSGAGTVGVSGSAFGGTVYVLGGYSVTNTTLTNGTLNFGHDNSVANLTMSGGTLTGLNDVTVTGLLNWTAGTMSGTGRTISSGVLNISGSGGKTLDTRTLNNAGLATWTGTDLSVINRAVLNNLAGATFDAQTDAALTAGFFNAPGSFNNAGTFTKSEGSGTTSVTIAFNNSGTAEVQIGTLQLNSTGTSSGTFTVDGGATLAFNPSGNHILTATSTVNGAGNIQFSGGTVYVLGSFTPGGAMKVNNGTVNFASSVDLAALTFTGGTITGFADVTVEGALTWTGGTMSGPGTTVSKGTMAVSNTSFFGGPTLDDRTLTNAGTATWKGTGTIGVNNGAVINNLAGATFLAQDNGALSTSGGGAFNNAGDFRKSASSGTTTFNIPFNNTGTVEAQTGTLILAGGGESTGSMSVSPSATLQFSGSTYALRSASSVDGAGTVVFSADFFGNAVTNVAGSYSVTKTVVNAGTVNFINDLSLDQLTLNGGTLTGPGNLTVSNALTWTGGHMSGLGSTTSTGTFNLSAGNSPDLNGRTLDNAGTATWTGTDTFTIRNGAVLDNQAGATFLIQSDTTLNGGGFFFDTQGTFLNEGLLRKQASSNTTTIGTLFTNTGTVDVHTGTLSFSGTYVQTSGATVVETGKTLAAAGGVLLQGGSLSGTGTVNGNVTNSGVVSPGGDSAAGVLTINGNYTLTEAGLLRIKLGGTTVGSQYDQLRVNGSGQSGNGVLAGTLEVDLINGFSPALNDSFQILTFSSHSGNFTTENLPILGGGLFLDPVLSTTSLTLVTKEGSSSVPPPPNTVFWINTSGGDWSTATNWSTGKVPGATDDVVIDEPGNVTITHSGGTDSIHSLQSEDALVLSGGSLSLATASTLDSAFTFSNGTVSGAGDLTVNGQLTWSGGTMTGTGHTIANGGLALSNTGDFFSPTTLDGRQLDNAGSATWTGRGNITISNGGQFNNLAGATFDAQSSASFSGSGPGAFNNAGSFLKTASGTTNMNIAFNNNGTVDVQAGMLSLNAGGDSTGAFMVETGTTLAISAGTTTLRSASSVAGGGTVRILGDIFGNGTVNVLGAYSVTSTALTGASINFANDATLTNLDMSGGTLTGFGDVTVTGVLNWTGGTMSGAGRTISSSTLNISGSNGKTLDTRTLNNAGAAIWTGTDLSVLNGAAFNNLAGATFDARTDAALTAGFFSTPGFFNNAGSFTKSQGTGITSVFIAFNNSGTAKVQTGTLRLNTGTSSGTFTADSGTTLIFNVSGIHTLTATSAVNGSGNVQFTTGTVYVLGTFAPGGTVTVSGANVNFVKDVNLAALAFTSGTITGSSTVTVSGLLNWTGGTMSGPGSTVANGTLTLSNSGFFGGPTLDGRTLNNAGTATWTGTQGITFSNAAVFNNLAGATFVVQANVNMSGDAASTFNNAGDFRKDSGTAITQINLFFTNTGSVEVNSGTLSLAQAGDYSGSMSVSSGMTLQFTGSTHVLRSSSSVTGDGTVQFADGGFFSGPTNIIVAGSYTVAKTIISNGIANFASDVSVARLTLEGSGQLTGAGNVTVTDALTWTAGAMTGPGSTSSSGALILNAGSTKDLNGRALSNAGTATWTGNDTLLVRNGAVLDNQAGAFFFIQNNPTITFNFGDTAGTVLNEGTLTKWIGNGTTNISTTFTNTGIVVVATGTLSFSRAYVQTSGATVLATGTTLVATGGVLLQGGSLSGTGTINGNVINSGVVSPGGDGAAGVLTINGNYTQTDTGVLRIDLGGTTVGTQYDQLHVSGSATLRGTLDVHLINNFSPVLGNTFQILTFASHSGDFTTKNFPALSGGLFLDEVFNPTNLTLVTKM
jgi:hypothetical protein